MKDEAAPAADFFRNETKYANGIALKPYRFTIVKSTPKNDNKKYIKTHTHTQVKYLKDML